MSNKEQKINYSFWRGCNALLEPIFDIDFDPNLIKNYKDFNKKIEVFNNNFTIPTSISADVKKYYKNNVIISAEIK